METNKQYILQWREHVLKAAEALKNQDYETYEAEIGEMESVYGQMRRDDALSYKDEETFGAANAMFESVLYDLYMENKPAVKEFMNTIKEDKNLQAQFMFYNTLKKYKKEFDRDKYLQEAVSLALKKINYKTIKESNKKLYGVLKKYGIKAKNYLNEDDLHFYRICESIFHHPKSLNNLAFLNETFNQVSSLLESRTKDTVTEDKKVMTVKEFAEKYNLILTEQEKDIINTLLDSSNEEKRERMFEKFRNSCINNIETMMTESSSDAKNRLNNLLENLNNKRYNKDTVLTDVVKILEINDILNA